MKLIFIFTILSNLNLVISHNWEPRKGGDWKTLTPSGFPIGNINPTGTFGLVAQTLNPEHFHQPNDNCDVSNAEHEKHCITETLTDYSSDCNVHFTEYYNSIFDNKQNIMIQGPKTTNSWYSCSNVSYHMTKTKCDMIYEMPTSTLMPTSTSTSTSTSKSLSNKKLDYDDSPVYKGLLAYAYDDGQIEVLNEECVDDDDGKLHYACYDSNSVMITIVDGIIYDEQGRIGSIVSNSQFQFDGPPPQAGSRFSAGWSLTDNYYLALGDQIIFYECPQDGAFKLYGYKLYDVCKEVMIKSIGIIHDCSD